MDPGLLAWSTFSGLWPLISVSIMGMILTHKKIYNKHVNNCIAKSYSSFFNPLFLFFNIVKSLNLSEFSSIWPLFLAPVLIFILGLLVSHFHSIIFKSNKSLSYIVRCAITFNNVGNLMIVLLRGMCSSYGALSGYSECSDANSYISILLFIYVPLVWSFGTSFIERSKFLQANLIGQSEVTPIWKTAIKNLMLPGSLACVSAFFVTLVPGSHDLFFSHDSFLTVLSTTCIEVGLAGIVLGQSSLGSNLILLKSEESKLSKSFIFSVVLFKNLVFPLISLALVYSMWSFGVFGGNIVMAYIVYTSFCAPTAIIILIICETHKHAVKEITWLLLFIYSSSLPGLIIFSYIFFLIFLPSTK